MPKFKCPHCLKTFQGQSGLDWHVANNQNCIANRVNELSSQENSNGQTSPVQDAHPSTSDNSVNLPCPTCGNSMVLRTNRNNGNQFWGCSQYGKGCRGTRPLYDAEQTLENRASTNAPSTPNLATPVPVATTTDSGLDTNASSISTTLDVPRIVHAEPYRSDFQVQFYQVCSLPSPWVFAISNISYEEQYIRKAAQWRLDFPLPKDPSKTSEQRVVLSIAQSLLTRGTTPFCPVVLEQVILNNASEIDKDELLIALKRFASNPTSSYRPDQYDSDEERLFHQIFDRWTDPRSGWSVLPQVHISSLVSSHSENNRERVDFLLTHAEGPAVVVEIDGSGHQGQEEKDDSRDYELSNAGFPTIRIPTAEVRAGDGPNLGALKAIVDGVSPEKGQSISDSIVGNLRIYKLAQQLQIAIIEALRGGWLEWDRPWTIGVVVPDLLLNRKNLSHELNLASGWCGELLTRLSALHGASFDVSSVSVLTDFADEDVDIVVTPIPAAESPSGGKIAAPIFFISDLCFPGNIAPPFEAASNSVVAAPSEENVKWFLDYLFRKNDFWEGQWESIERTLQGKDSVVLLPTGGGKSIAFQLAAMLLPGRCVVVDPIISLIDDQIDNLNRVGIQRCVGISGQLNRREMDAQLAAFSAGHYQFCYVAPERFQIEGFRQHLRALTAATAVSAIVVDEAHCVSEWGHDFRTSYLNLGRISRQYCSSGSNPPPLIALTGTASKIVLKDVQRELGISDIEAIVTPTSFDRPELKFSVLECSSSEKSNRISGFITRLPSDFAISSNNFFEASGDITNSGLVFCPHVNGEFGIVQQSKLLSNTLGVPVSYYSGGAPRGIDHGAWNSIKQSTAKSFKRNEQPLMACTKAYGMGIDKPNVRYTVHIGLPDSVESFYQEAGRAGRDRQTAQCAIIMSNDYPQRTQQLLHPGISPEEISDQISNIDWNAQDDVTRALYFHVLSFKGEDAELSDVVDVVNRLGTLSEQRTVRLSEQGDSRDRNEKARRTEKALHRLVVIGVVQDYTVAYPSDFDVMLTGARPDEVLESFCDYVSSYQRSLVRNLRDEAELLQDNGHSEFVLEISRLLIHFIYTHIERARRRSLNEMLDAASQAQTGEDLRARILDHLENSEFDARLEEVIASDSGGLDFLDPLLDDLISPKEAMSLRGSVARILGSYPDNPGLLFLRAISEILSSDSNLETASQNLQAGIQFALGEYRGPEVMVQVIPAISKILAVAMNKKGAADCLLVSALEAPDMTRELNRQLLSQCPSDVAWLPAAWLSNELTQRSTAIRTG